MTEPIKTISSTRYELPREGITLLGYIVRRMHKTRWLVPVSSLLVEGKNPEALAYVTMYAATASTSFGPAYYQPNFDSVGDVITEPDPETGAIVKAVLESASPTYRISYTTTMPEGGVFLGSEEITGTTISIRGLGMPAPSKFQYSYHSYKAELTGILTSELTISLLKGTSIRGFGFLNLEDNAGNRGKLELDRNNRIAIQVNGKTMEFDSP